MISVQRIVNVRQSIIFDWKCKVMRPNTKVVATGLFLVVEAPQEPGASESMFDFLSPHLVFFYPPLILFFYKRYSNNKAHYCCSFTECLLCAVLNIVCTKI